MPPNDLAVLAMWASISCSSWLFLARLLPRYVCKAVHHLDFSTPEVDGCHCFVVLATTPNSHTLRLLDAHCYSPCIWILLKQMFKWLSYFLSLLDHKILKSLKISWGRSYNQVYLLATRLLIPNLGRLDGWKTGSWLITVAMVVITYSPSVFLMVHYLLFLLMLVSWESVGCSIQAKPKCIENYCVFRAGFFL